MTGVTWTALLPRLLPELLVLGAALLVILLDLVVPRDSRRWLGWFTGAVAVAIVASLVGPWAALSPGPAGGGGAELLWGGVFVIDRLGLLFKAIFLLGVAIAAIGSADYAAGRFRHLGEYYALLLLSALGMMLMASAGDLLTLYLGLSWPPSAFTCSSPSRGPTRARPRRASSTSSSAPSPPPFTYTA